VRTRRDKVGIRLAGDPTINAHCPVCGHRFTAVTADRDATVDHRCPSADMGPAWTLVNSRGGRQIPKAALWGQHQAGQGMRA
jgi:hypothetical protein